MFSTGTSALKFAPKSEGENMWTLANFLTTFPKIYFVYCTSLTDTENVTVVCKRDSYIVLNHFKSDINCCLGVYVNFVKTGVVVDDRNYAVFRR